MSHEPLDKDLPEMPLPPELPPDESVEGVDDLVGALRKAVEAARARRLSEHSSNPREDG